MINELITTLLYPDMGKYAFRLYDALNMGEISMNMFSELIAALHRLSLCSYYEIVDADFGDVNSDYRYLDPCDLCENGASFALLCLTKIIKEHKAKKNSAVVTAGNYSFNIHEMIKKLELTAEMLGDEDELTENWTNKLNEFILWTPEKDCDFCMELLNILEPSNADIIFGYCTRFWETCLPDKFKEDQVKNPEDFFKLEEIREYHAYRTHSVFCYSFLDRADANEHRKVVEAQDKAEKALSVKELLFALTEEDIYLNVDITFPFTVYHLLMNKNFDVQLNAMPAN